MENDNDQKAGGSALPNDSQKADGSKEGDKPEIKVVDDDSKKDDLETRLKGLQGSLQSEVEARKAAEKRLKEIEFEQLSEAEKVQAKLKEAEERATKVEAEKTALEVKDRWNKDWSKIKEKYPNSSKLPLIVKKAESNPGALGDGEAVDYESWLASVEEELSETEKSLEGKVDNPDFKKVNNTNASEPSKKGLYDGLSLEDKAKRLEEDLGIKSNW